jgi:steroid delta-isomerase-like uncharacterized protein
MDRDLDTLNRGQLQAEVRRLRDGIRAHRDSTGHDLCWHHPDLWGLLPETTDPVPAVPDWPDFLRGCIRYRQSLDARPPGSRGTDMGGGMAGSDTGRVAREFFGVWTAGNLERLDRWAAPDLVVKYAHFPEPLRGREAFRAALETTFRHFPDLETRALSVIVRDDRAAVEWEYEGTHREGELFGVPASGTRVRVAGATFYRVREGRVVEERGVADVLGLMAQLGALG